MDRIKWYLMQLLPLEYHTVYKQEGKTHHTIWRMWFGRSFNVRDRIIS